MRWGGNNSYYVRRRAIWKEMSAKISALVKISSIILRRYICLLLCLSPKCNNGENKFALRWNETRGWYLFVFVAWPCLPCQSRLRSALPCLTSPAISPSPLSPHPFYHDVGVSPQFSLFPAFFRASTGSHGRATSRHSISPRWRSDRRGAPPPAGRAGCRWPESRAELQRSIRINQAAPIKSRNHCQCDYTWCVSLPLGWNWARIAFLSVFHLSYIHTQPELLFWN